MSEIKIEVIENFLEDINTNLAEISKSLIKIAEDINTIKHIETARFERGR
jgi:hypothetical protein